MALRSNCWKNTAVYDVVVYLTSLPRIAGRNRKIDVLRAFAAGAHSQGMQVLLQDQCQVVPSRLAVILGWVGMNIRGPHIQLRQNVIDQQRQAQQQVMAIDGSCFKFADNKNEFLRYSLGGVYYNTNNYANHDSDGAKWTQISQCLGLQLAPWRAAGEHILICLQRDGGWSMKGVDMRAWVRSTVKTLRQHTDRPILIRPHPKCAIDLSDLTCKRDIFVSVPESTLQDDIRGAWASVFFNSSSCVASILAGVPVFAADPDCVAWRVADSDLSRIEHPNLPERQSWLNDLATAHWTDAESSQGLILEKFKPWL